MENQAVMENETVVTTSDTGYVTEMPTLTEEQLFGSLLSLSRNGNGHKVRTVDLRESYIIGFGGPRGSGKSESLAFCGVKARALGLPVWSNFPIKFRFIDRWEHEKILESKPLYFKDLFAISPEIHGGLVLIDEYQDWASALSFMSTQNRLLNAFWAQIRKNDLSFFYASKKLRWIDVKTREETDIEIDCADAYFSEEGYGKHRKGEVVYWNIFDLSGMWTGQMWEMNPLVRSKRFYARSIWGAYDTKLRFDIFEALRGVKLDLEKSIISDKEPRKGFDFSLLESQIEQIFQQRERVQAAELFATLGIVNNFEKAQASSLLFNLGIERKPIAGASWFVKSGVGIVPSPNK